MSDSSEVRVWRCDHGHVLGHIQTRYPGGWKTTELVVYRQALDQAHPGAEPDVMLVTRSEVIDVRCSICGSMRTFVPGAAEINRMIERFRREEITV